MKKFAVVAVIACVLLSAVLAQAAEPAKSTLPMGSPNTVIVVRTANVKAVVDKFIDTMVAFNPDMAEQAKEMKTGFFTEIPGVDQTGPAALLLLGPEAVTDMPRFGPPMPFVFVLQLQDPAAFAKIGADADEDGPKIAIVGKLGLVSISLQAIDEVKAALVASKIEKIPVDDVKDLVVVNANAAESMKRYRPMINLFVVKAKTKLKTLNVPAGEGPFTTEQLQAMGTKGLDYLVALCTEIEKQGGPVAIEANFGPDRISGKIKATLAANSDADKFIRKNNKPANADLANYLPADACLAAVKNTDPQSAGTLTAGMIGIALDFAGATPDEIQQVKTAFAEAAPSFTGLTASASVPTKGGQTSVVLLGINDPKKAQESMKKIVDLASKGAAGTTLGKFGITLKYTENCRRQDGVPVDKIDVAIDYDKLGAAMNVSPDKRAEMKKDLSRALAMMYGGGDSIALELVYARKLMAVTYGSDFQEMTNAQITRLKGRGTDGLGAQPLFKAAIARHPNDASSCAVFSLTRYADVLANIEKVFNENAAGTTTMPRKDELPPEQAMMSMSVSSDKNTVIIGVDVPMQPIIDFMKVTEQKQRKAWEERRKNMPNKAEPMD